MVSIKLHRSKALVIQTRVKQLHGITSEVGFHPLKGCFSDGSWCWYLVSVLIWAWQAEWLFPGISQWAGINCRNTIYLLDISLSFCIARVYFLRGPPEWTVHWWKKQLKGICFLSSLSIPLSKMWSLLWFVADHIGYSLNFFLMDEHVFAMMFMLGDVPSKVQLLLFYDKG